MSYQLYESIPVTPISTLKNESSYSEGFEVPPKYLDQRVATIPYTVPYAQEYYSSAPKAASDLTTITQKPTDDDGTKKLTCELRHIKYLLAILVILFLLFLIFKR